MQKKYSVSYYREPQTRLFFNPSHDTGALELQYDGNGVLSYCTRSGTEVRLYHVPVEALKTLKSNYSAHGFLKSVEITFHGVTHLVYIHYQNEEEPKTQIFSFAKYQGECFAERICALDSKLARLFTEYFYDGNSVDFSVRTGTPEELEQLSGCSGAECAAIDNSFEYPVAQRISCDNETFRILLLCAPETLREDLFGFAVFLMNERIQEIIPHLNKTDDFRFISTAYD